MDSQKVRIVRNRQVLGWAGLMVAGVFVLGLISPAAAGGGVGARFGYANVSDDVFTGSGDLGGTNLIGLQVNFNLGPLLAIEAAGEYVSEKFSFTEGLFEGIEAAGDGKYEDMGLFVTGRIDLLNLMILPLKGYAGGGVNAHWVNLKVENAEAGDPGNADQLENAIEKVAGDSSEAGWHLVAGVRFAPVGLPLAAFLEGRYMKGLDDDLPSSKAIYLGVNIAL